MCNAPFKFQSLLLTFAEADVIYLNEDFDIYFNNINFLLSALHLAKRLTSRRVQYRQCFCYSRQRLSFTAVLIKIFSNTTLSHYLLNGDEMELDLLKYEIRINVSAFDFMDVITAFHKVKSFKKELFNVRKLLVVNPFMTVSDFEESDDNL